MRRRNRIAAVVLAAALLAVGLAPPAAAQAPLGPLGWLDAFGRSVAAWWSALAGDEGDRASAGSEVTPDGDPDDNEVTPRWDHNGTNLSTEQPPDDGNEVSPDWDPNG